MRVKVVGHEVRPAVGGVLHPTRLISSLTGAAALFSLFLWTGVMATAGQSAFAQDGANPANPPAANPQPVRQIGVPPLNVLVQNSGDTEIDQMQPIKSGFTLSVQVSSAAGPEPDLTGNFVVDATGSIPVKLAGPVVVRGLTPTQAGQKIETALKPYVKDPKVVVAIVGVPKPVILITGHINQNGSVPINDNTTLAEVLTVFGTPDTADLARVRVARLGPNGKRVYTEYNFLKWLNPPQGQTPDETQNPVLSDRDMVYVPSRSVGVVTGPGQVEVTGAVVSKGLINLRAGVPTTLREAIAQSGGPAATADRRRVVVRRTGVEKDMLYDFDRVEAGDAASNIALQPGDVVYLETLNVNKFVNLNGGFIRPGKLPFNQQMTLTQAIAEAGGVATGAKVKEGRIYRHLVNGDPTKTQIIAFNYLDIRKGKQVDMTIEPGDTIEVPIGVAPAPPLDSLQLTQSLLSIALIVDRIFSGGRTGGF